MSFAGSPRFLITRLGHIGDTVLTWPLLSALREHFPKAFIAWVVERPSDQLLAQHECLDHLIVLRKGWLKSPTRVMKLRRQLLDLRFDTAIDPQSLTKSAVVARLSNAPRRIGFAPPQGRELAPWLNTENVEPKKTHLVDKQLELLRPMGIRRPDVLFRTPRDADAESAIDRFVRNSHLGCGFAVINPGAGWASRRWDPRRYGSVAKHLGQHHGVPSVVAWAGDDERQMAEDIVRASGGHGLMAPATTLRELVALMRAARMYIGSDTGPMHLAVSVDTPSVVLHGTTRWQESGPYGSQHVPVQRYFQSGSSRERRQGTNAAMQAISADDVCEACEKILHRQDERAA